MLKARVLKTGKVVEVERDLNTQPASGTGAIYVFKDKDGNTYFNTDLNFNEVYPDWQKIRVQASIAAMQGIVTAISPERFTCRPGAEAVAKASIEYADALVGELLKDYGL